MAFCPCWSRLDFTVHQPDDPAVPTQAFKERDFVHVSAHRFCIRLVKRNTFDRIYLVGIVHYTVNARRAALANQIEPSVRLLAHNEVARPHLRDGHVRHLVLTTRGNMF